MKHLSRKYKKRILRKNKISKKKIKPKKSVNRKSVKKSVNRKKTTTRKRRRVGGGGDSDSEEDEEVAKYFPDRIPTPRIPTPYNNMRSIQSIQSSDIEQGDTTGEVKRNNTRKVKPPTSFLNRLRSLTPSNFLRTRSMNNLRDGESGRESKESVTERGKELPFENYKLTVEGELLTENTSPFNSQEEPFQLLGVKVNKPEYDEYVTNFNKLKQKGKTESYKTPLSAHDYDMVTIQFNNFLDKYSSIISDKDFYLSKLTDPEFVDDIDTIIGKLEENIEENNRNKQKMINMFQQRSSSFVDENSSDSGDEGYKTAESGRSDSTSSDDSVDSTIALIRRGKPIDSKVNESVKNTFRKIKEDEEREKKQDTRYRKEDYYSKENMEKRRKEKEENLKALRKEWGIETDSD